MFGTKINKGQENIDLKTTFAGPYHPSQTYHF